MKEHVKRELTKRKIAREKKALETEAAKAKGEAVEEESKGDPEDLLAGDGEDDLVTETTRDEESKYMEIEELALMDEEELEKQLELPNSFADLCSDHFPMFLTVKRLIYMLDASLDFPFFSRNYDG
jgi:hypothetical protein